MPKGSEYRQQMAEDLRRRVEEARRKDAEVAAREQQAKDARKGK